MLRVAVLSALVHAFGCGASWLTAHVARDMDCPSKQLEAHDIGSGYYEVAGCNRRALYQCADATSRDVNCVRVQTAPLAVEQREVRVRSKAAVLLSCDPSALKILGSEPGYYSAQGCGKNIDYECVSGTDCCAFERPGVRTLEEIAASTSRASIAREKNVKPSPSSSDASAAPLPASALDHPPGSLSKRVIRQSIGERIDEVRRCYEAVLGDPPSVTGIVTVKFIIDPMGRVQIAALERSSLGQQQAESCIVNLVQTWEFPPPQGGGIVVVTYPFRLETPPPHAACR